MGVIFPIYANLFVEWKPGLFPFFAAGAVMAGITVGVANYFMVTRILLRPLKSITALANDLSQKNLNQRLGIESNDLVGSLAQDLNRGMQDVAHAIQSVSVIATEVNQAIHTIWSQSQQSTDSMTHIRNQTDSLHNTMNHFFQFSEQITHAITKMESSIQDVNLIFRQIQSHIDSIVIEADASKEISQDANRMIQDIHQSFSQLTSVIGTLHDNAQQSMHITKRTHLLSLNASIEAATAGNEGKGFAVIASEVRELANHSSREVEKMNDGLAQIRNLVNAVSTQLDTHRSKLDSSQKNAEHVHQNAKEVRTELSNGVSILGGIHESVRSIQEQTTHLSQQAELAKSSTENIESHTHLAVEILEELNAQTKTVAGSSESLDHVIHEFRVN